MFSRIAQNWRGRPLLSHEAIVDLIATTTTTGLKIRAGLDTPEYPLGFKSTDAQLGAWNYALSQAV